MDKTKASSYESLFKGKQIVKWIVGKLIGYGKSAAVLRAEAEGKIYAIKIFDTELDERFGHEIQLKRIEQEIGLKGHGIPNLIDIVDGGQFVQEGQTYHYIVMPFVEGKDLKQFIQSETYAQEFIVQTLRTLVDVTEKLLERSVVHRDIKPENIVVTASGDIVLMDLGVLKLVGTRSFTDEEQKQFVGTLRNAPPEFLFRDEHDTLDGWRAVNLYQIGAILHDLIMKRELFAGVSPYTQLVLAIKETNPEIANPGIDGRLITLARNLLAKDWKKRLEYGAVAKVRDMLSSLLTPQADTAEKYKQEIAELTSKHRSSMDEIRSITTSMEQRKKKLQSMAYELNEFVQKRVEEVARVIGAKIGGVFGNFPFSIDKTAHQLEAVWNAPFRLESDMEHGFLRPFFVIAKMRLDVEGNCQIGVSAIFCGPILGHNFNNFDEVLADLSVELIHQRIADPVSKSTAESLLRFKTVFEGIVSLDEALAVPVEEGIKELCIAGLKAWSPLVEMELRRLREYALNGRTSLHPPNDRTLLFPIT